MGNSAGLCFRLERFNPDGGTKYIISFCSIFYKFYAEVELKNLLMINRGIAKRGRAYYATSSAYG